MRRADVIRTARMEELETIVMLKIRMFEDAGLRHLLKADVEREIREAYEDGYRSDTIRHYVRDADGEVVACAGAFLKSDLPYFFYRAEFYGFIGDVYVLPAYRRQGYARRLTEEAIGWLRGKGAEMIRLLATPQGRPLYESLGFKSTNEMALTLD